MKNLTNQWIKNNYQYIILFSVIGLVLFFILKEPTQPDYSKILDLVKERIEAENKAILDTISQRDIRIQQAEQSVKILELKLKDNDKKLTDLKTKYEKIRIDNANLTVDGTVDVSRKYLSE